MQQVTIGRDPAPTPSTNPVTAAPNVTPLVTAGRAADQLLPAVSGWVWPGIVGGGGASGAGVVSYCRGWSGGSGSGAGRSGGRVVGWLGFGWQTEPAHPRPAPVPPPFRSVPTDAAAVIWSPASG